MRSSGRAQAAKKSSQRAGELSRMEIVAQAHGFHGRGSGAAAEGDAGCNRLHHGCEQARARYLVGTVGFPAQEGDRDAELSRGHFFATAAGATDRQVWDRELCDLRGQCLQTEESVVVGSRLLAD